ncbi:DMT family transporter [Candidatus Clostridium radicumherbarum]|uniref:DMT family transporter n=1 Tax=Candidatus Clostridium radicumherbarum TaxID=3381662 RepID=A0ABW8TVG0_9CLOT
MKKQEVKSSLLLLLAAAIWGFAFVAQRIGSKYVGSFMFNGVRFALGSLSLVPLLLVSLKKDKSKALSEEEVVSISPWKPGIILGCVIFLAASLQQIGLVETSAGKAAFITGFYIVLVPVFGIFLKHNIHKATWVGVILAIIGLYFLSVTEGFTVAMSDIYELIGAFLWAIHILLIDNFTKKVDALKLSFVQFLTCSILSLIAAFIFEKNTLIGLSQAVIPILYGGICSVGIAYTLQVIGQKNAKPSHAAIVLSMESVFAAIGGLIILHENLGARGYIGCGLMFAGVILSQYGSFPKQEKATLSN